MDSSDAMNALSRMLFPHLRVLGAEIRRGTPFLYARTRRIERNPNGRIERVLPEWTSDWVWYPSWEQFDTYWADQLRIGTEVREWLTQRGLD